MTKHCRLSRTVFSVSPKNLKDLNRLEISLLENIPEASRKMFNILFKAYLKKSINNGLVPDDHLNSLLIKFYNENAELRYPPTKKNPYLNPRYKRANDPGYNWRKKATDEYYHYYDGVFQLLNSMRNFQTHKEDAFTSTQFELSKRKLIEPVSGIENPANYLVLSNSVILSVYAFIEIMQTWVDTQVRLDKI